MRISADRAPAELAPRVKAMASFRRECCQFVALYLAVFDWKVQRFCWPKGTSLECAESIYVKITETACVSDELCCLKEEEEEEGEDRLATLSIPTVRLVDLEYS